MPKISAPTIHEHRELRRQQLISASLELALDEGAGAVTVAAVAKKAGLARSSIYEYFASSADLIADLIIEGLRYVADGRHMLVKSLNTISTPESRKEEISMGHRKMIAPLRQALVETGIKDPVAAAAFLSSVTDAASIRIDAGNEAELEIQSAIIFALAGLRALARN